MLRERSSYRRVLAPICHRPTSWLTQGLPRRARVAALAGLRSYSDDLLKVGRLLSMDVFLRDGSRVSGLVEVEWCEPMPKGFAARFDVGLRLLRMEHAERSRLDAVLEAA